MKNVSERPEQAAKSQAQQASIPSNALALTGIATLAKFFNPRAVSLSRCKALFLLHEIDYAIIKFDEAQLSSLGFYLR